MAILGLIAGLGTYAERKISADIQSRIGPNRVGPYGLFQFIADAIKVLVKSDLIPFGADRPLFMLAPLVSLVGVFLMVLVLPFSEFFTLYDSDVALLYLLGVTSFVGIGIFLGGHASYSKWSLLGGLRAAAQIVSYEIPISLSFVSIVLLSGSSSLGAIVKAQGHNIFQWYIFHNPFSFLLFFIFFIASLAEANRAPFDLPEAESELVSGFHTEYSGVRFALYAFAEYLESFLLCVLAVVLFFGGYHFPFLSFDKDIFISNPLLLNTFQLCVIFFKSFLIYYLVIVTRWTFPRLRVDQLMSLCWKYLIPINLVLLLGLSLWVLLFGGQSLFDLLFLP